MDLLVSQDPLGQRVKQGPLVPVDLRGHKDLVESRASLELRGLLEPLVTPVLTATPEPKDQWALLVSPVLLVFRVHTALLDLREQLVHLDQRDSLVIWVCLGSRVKRVLKEKLVTVGLKVPQVPLERKVSEDPEESLVHPDPSDHTEREALLVTEVFLDKMVWPVQRALWVSVELQEYQVLKEPAVILDGLENPVCPVQEV